MLYYIACVLLACHAFIFVMGAGFLLPIELLTNDISGRFTGSIDNDRLWAYSFIPEYIILVYFALKHRQAKKQVV